MIQGNSSSFFHCDQVIRSRLIACHRICIISGREDGSIAAKSSLGTFSIAHFNASEHEKVARQIYSLKSHQSFSPHSTKNLTASLCGCVQNNSTCLKREYNDRQSHKMLHNILTLSLLLSLPFITLLTHTREARKSPGGRPWPRHSQLVPVPTRKQLIMCERLSECLLSGQQQHSAIYLPSRQDGRPAQHADTHSHPHTHTEELNAHIHMHKAARIHACTENALIRQMCRGTHARMQVLAVLSS